MSAAPRHRRRILAQVAAAALLAAHAGRGAEAGDPVQLWTDFARSFGEGRTSVSTAANLRLAEGGDVSTWNAEAGLVFRAGDHFAWGPGYKFQRQRDPGGPFLDESRYLLAGRLAWGTAAWKGEVRALYEYRHLADEPDLWRMRLRPALSRAIGDGVWTFAASDEVFYDSGQDRLAQNRARLGLQRRPGGGVGFGIYYMIRSDRRDGHWEETQILGTAWTLP